MYKLNKSTAITRKGDLASIPNDPNNSDYTAYLAWIAEGNTPDPVDLTTPEEIAAAAQAAQDKADKDTAKADSVIRYLVTHSPAECDDYVKANVTNLATAVNLLGKLAMALCVLAKAELR